MALLLLRKKAQASLAESVEFESEEKYREKLEVLKESYFARTTNESAKEISKAQTLSEGVDSTPGSCFIRNGCLLKCFRCI